MGALVVAGAFLASVATAFASGGAVQKPPTGQMQRAPQQMERRVDPNATRLEVESLVVTVGSTPTPATTLRSGDLVTVTLTIKNAAASTAARAPWSIQVSTGNIIALGSGQEMNMAPGEVRSVSARWTATAGQRVFQGDVDPANHVQNTAPASARKKELTFNVVQISAQTQGSGETPQMEVRVLDRSCARQAGANFSQGADGMTPCRHDFAGGTFGVPDSGVIMLDVASRSSPGAERTTSSSGTSV